MNAKNPFSNAKVVSHRTNPAKYHGLGEGRGLPGFVMSRSELTEFYHCPRRWVRGYRRKDSDAMNWGSLIDCLVLEPETFDSRYVLPPREYPCTPTKKDPRTSKPWTNRADYCKEWEEQVKVKGKIVLKYEDYLQAQTAAKLLKEDAEIATFINACVPSVMVTADYWDESTGLTIPVKILIDLLPDLASPYGHGLGDLKTCDTADDEAWARSVFNYNYHVQAAFYLDVYNAATNEERTDFFHVLQESYFPFEPGKQLLTSEFLELGRLKYQNALREYALCLATGKWPTYGFARQSDRWNGWKFTKPQLWMLNAA